MPDMGTRLATTVKRIREQKGLSLRVAAKAAGMSKGTIEAIERAQTHRPEPKTFTGLSQALGTPKQELVLDAALDTLEEWAPALEVSLDTLVELLHQRLAESQV